jgi:hypothetical protein
VASMVTPSWILMPPLRCRVVVYNPCLCVPHQVIGDPNPAADGLCFMADGQTDYEARKNVLLLGDSLGDLHMSDGLQFNEILR